MEYSELLVWVQRVLRVKPKHERVEQNPVGGLEGRSSEHSVHVDELVEEGVEDGQ